MRWFKKIYRRRYWIQDWTPNHSVWFSTPTNTIVSVDYAAGCSDTAKANTWKEVSNIVDAMVEEGSTHIIVSQITWTLGKRYWVDYEYDFDKEELK